MTNLRHNVSVTYDVDNLYGQNKGNFSQEEFHVISLSATNHLSCDNLEVQRTPIQLDFSDTSTPHLPDSYAVIHPVEGERVNVIYAYTGTGSHFRPVRDREAKKKDESWMARVTTILQQDTLPQGEVITWSGYNSRLMSD